MKEIYNVLSEFKSMKEYSDFMSSLVEKTTSGHEISRGMDSHDKSKQEKKQVVSKEVQKNADGSSTETHFDQVDPSVEQPPVEPNPPLAPGQQVNIGNKVIDPSLVAPKTVDIKTGQRSDKINTKPQISKNPDKAL